MTEDGGAHPRSVVIAYDGGALAGDAAAQDVVTQMEVVGRALEGAGSVVTRLPADLNLERFKKRLLALRPDLVFNLVESLGGSDRLQTLVPMLLENLRLPFTGSGAAAMLLANHKIGAKQALAAHGLPVPDCAWLGGGQVRFFPEDAREKVAGRWIAKALASHASLSLDDTSVFTVKAGDELAARLAAAEKKTGEPFFAERFIDGREYNISVLGDAKGEPEVLPPAEIEFRGYPADKPRILCYAAKWNEASAEYVGTVRTFEAGAGDAALHEKLRAHSVAAWKVLGLSGYARVDFRVDAAGEPFILEANANPCLSPDAGMVVAAERAGLDYAALCRRIVDAALADPRL